MVREKSIEKTVTNTKLKRSKGMHIGGAARKPFNEKLNEFVLEWIHERRRKGVRVSRKFVMKKAIVKYDNMVKEGESNEDFKTSTGWLRGFMKRYSLSLQQKSSSSKRPRSAHRYIGIFYFTCPLFCHKTSIRCC